MRLLYGWNIGDAGRPSSSSREAVFMSSYLFLITYPYFSAEFWTYSNSDGRNAVKGVKKSTLLLLSPIVSKYKYSMIIHHSLNNNIRVSLFFPKGWGRIRKMLLVYQIGVDTNDHICSLVIGLPDFGQQQR